MGAARKYPYSLLTNLRLRRLKLYVLKVLDLEYSAVENISLIPIINISLFTFFFFTNSEGG
jgi:hypothetical protein